MNILFLSRNGDGVSLAYKLDEDEKNHVKLFCQKSTDVGKGLVDRSLSWRTDLRWADLVVADGPEWGNYEDVFKNFGKPVLGISQLTKMLWQDRLGLCNLLEGCGINVPRRWEVTQPADNVIEEVLSQWTNGVLCFGDGFGVFQCREPEDFRFVVDTFYYNQLFVVERFEGVKVRTTGWFNGRTWAEPFYYSLMDTRELVGDMGRAVCMGGAVYKCVRNKLVESVLAPLESFLASAGYRGPVTVSSKVLHDEVYTDGALFGLAIEDTEAMLEGCRDSVTDLMFEAAQGVLKSFSLTDDVMAVVRVASRSGVGGTPIADISAEAMKHVWLNEVFKEQGRLRQSGKEATILKATAIGRDTREAVKRAMRTAKGVHFMNKYFRVDVGERAIVDRPRLKEWGWLDA